MRNNLIKVNIDKETLITIGSAFLMVTLSFIMNLFQKNEFVAIILRNILMIFLLGFCFPLYYILIRKRKNLSELGFTRKKLGISLIINVVLAVLLFMIFSHKQHSAISVNLNSFYAITYIIVAGIFEMIFIYGFLRYEFERSFGVWVLFGMY